MVAAVEVVEVVVVEIEEEVDLEGVGEVDLTTQTTLVVRDIQYT